MPLYRCAKCGSVENTALGGYWAQGYNARVAGEKHVPLCSACNPAIGEWHGRFERKQADGYLVDRGGFLWTEAESKRVPHLGPFSALSAQGKGEQG